MSLAPRFTLGSLDLTEYPFAVEFGSDLGNPTNAVELMASLLPDGEIVTATRKSNRSIVLPIWIEGSDLREVEEAQALLVAECDRAMNTLTVDPGDGYAAVGIFDTFAAELSRAYDDDTEIATVRRWQITIPALPFRRGTELIIDDAGTPPSSGGTLLYNCESTTGWATTGAAVTGIYAVDNVIFTEGAGSLRSQVIDAESYFGTNDYAGYHYTYGVVDDEVTGLSLDTDTGGYLTIAIRTDWSDSVPGISVTTGLNYLFMQVAGAWVEVTYTATSIDAEGFVHYVWPVDAGLTVTGLKMRVVQLKIGDSATRPYVRYDDVELLPSATTDKQIIKQLEVQGSARTTGSLRVSSASEVTPLGHVLAITAPTNELPAGFQPDGERWVTQGTTTVDATAIEGHYYTPDTDYTDAATYPIFDVPVAMLTAGPYTMVALVKAEASTLTFGVQAQLNVDGTMVGPTSEAEVSPTGLTTGWQFVVVGTVYLPPLPVQSADATTYARLLFKGAKMANVYMIPAWQVGGRAVADFSIVDCGDGTVEPGGSSSSLWIDSPSTSQPQGGWWRGPTTDRANTQSAWPDAKKPGIHTFKPGLLTAFLVSTEAAGPTLTLSYYDAYL